MISVICCYSNKETLRMMLEKSLDQQKIDFEKIFVDNTEGRFHSAAAALNYGFEKSTGEYVVFVHQDVTFNDEDFLEEIKCAIDQLGGNVLVGPAGIKEKNGVYSNITHGPEQKLVGKYRLGQPVKVQTLDEVLIATKREVFQHFFFDESTCDNWHLYGVDLCLSAEGEGVDSYVIPLKLHHHSSGKVDTNYMKTLGKVVQKHKGNYSEFVTTISLVKTKYFNQHLYAANYRSKHFLAPKLKKIGISKDMFRKRRN